MIEAADHLVDFGPGSGDARRRGHRGRPADEGQEVEGLAHRQVPQRHGAPIPVPTNRRPADGPAIVVRGARQHNLKDVDAAFPIGLVTVVTGVSGLGQELAGRGHPLEGRRARSSTGRRSRPGRTTRSRGWSRSTRSSASTRPRSAARRPRPRRPTPGAFDLIRELFAKLPEAKVRGYTPRPVQLQPGREAGARRARGPARSGSRCTSCPTSGSPATPATARGTRPRRSP